MLNCNISQEFTRLVYAKLLYDHTQTGFVEFNQIGWVLVSPVSESTYADTCGHNFNWNIKNFKLLKGVYHALNLNFEEKTKNTGKPNYKHMYIVDGLY
jgi:hypothetical protein